MTYSGGDVVAWQQALKAKIQTLRGPELKRIALKAVYDNGVTDLGDHTRQKISIASTKLTEATGYLLRPKTAANGAALIAAPGHYEFGKDTIAGCDNAAREINKQPGSDYGRAAVRAGYTVFVPDFWGWGDKNAHMNLIGRRDRCNVIAMAAAMYGYNVLNLHLLEMDAMVDFLMTLDGIDARRIGIMGNSNGGRMTMWMAALNPNIACAVASGSMNLFAERAGKLASCMIQFFPGILQYADMPDIFSLIAPKPLQMQAGDQDPLITPDDRDHIAKTVGAVYEKFGAADRLSVEVFAGGHEFRWALAQPFLDKWL